MQNYQIEWNNFPLFHTIRDLMLRSIFCWQLMFGGWDKQVHTEDETISVEYILQILFLKIIITNFYIKKNISDLHSRNFYSMILVI